MGADEEGEGQRAVSAANASALRHPWLWALFPLVMSIALAGRSGHVLLGIGIGGVMFIITGWSWSRGWARRHYGGRAAAIDSEGDGEE